MPHRNDVSPNTLGVEIDDGAVVVEYLDGRQVTYETPPETAEGEARCGPGKDAHVLVTDASEREGVLVYVNDRNTHDDILESSGVGRVILEPGESTELFPGVRARVDDHAVSVESDDAVEGRVFVFCEDEFGERAVELGGES